MEGFAGVTLTEQQYNNKKNMDSHIGALQFAKHGNPRKQGLRHFDPETDYKVRRITNLVNESLTLAANEPSIGFYRIQEHVHRTMANLVQKKRELKGNAQRVDGALYDLGLSMNVVENIANISHFTRIKEALNTTIELKKKLNEREEKKKNKAEENMRKAKEANKSLSLNERAEGYICPVCYFALTSQDELISHWQREHSLDKYDNDVFQEVEVQSAEEFIVNNLNDMAVIDMPNRTYSTISESEDVVASFDENEAVRYSETTDSIASAGSGSDVEFEGPELVINSNENKIEIRNQEFVEGK